MKPLTPAPSPNQASTSAARSKARCTARRRPEVVPGRTVVAQEQMHNRREAGDRHAVIRSGQGAGQVHRRPLHHIDRPLGERRRLARRVEIPQCNAIERGLPPVVGRIGTELPDIRRPVLQREGAAAANKRGSGGIDVNIQQFPRQHRKPAPRQQRRKTRVDRGAARHDGRRIRGLDGQIAQAIPAGKGQIVPILLRNDVRRTSSATSGRPAVGGRWSQASPGRRE